MHTGRNLRIALGATAALLWLAVFPARAQDRVPANSSVPSAVTTPGPITHGELTEFDGFLGRHPFIEARLRENPSLVNDPAFRKNHPPFVEFLARHPGFNAQLAARSRWFIHRELVQQSATAVTPAQVAEFDRFLDQHPGLERLLAQHPQMLRNPDFFNRLPELRDYLKQHPGIGRAAESRPGRLMQRRRESVGAP